MRVLAVETSTKMGGAALIEEGRLVAEFRNDAGFAHSEVLIGAIDRILVVSHLHISEIDGFAVSIGPGSFTGLRVGLATVKGLAFAQHRPLVPVSSLAALAHNIPYCPSLLCPMIDARKKEVYSALFRYGPSGLERITEDRVCSPIAQIQEIGERTVFLGDGADLCWEVISGQLGEKALLAPSHVRYPSAASVAEIGLARLRRGEWVDSASVVPLYIRRSEAEINREKKRNGVSPDERTSRSSYLI